MNWTVLIIFGIAALALIIFLVVRNQKDEKNFEEDLKGDETPLKEDSHDTTSDKLAE